MMVLAAVAALAMMGGGQRAAVEPGALTIAGGAPMPLERTSVDARIEGFGARVTVRQRFTNPSRTPVEAIYTFPLPHDAAVDGMRMRIGSRVIEGEIKRREEARRVYEAAKAAGQTAALLDQETPNIFTQSVANITPGAKIEVEITYVQVLKYEEGQFEFVFPMVVGHRYTGAGTPNPDKISPPITPKGTRTGQNIDLKVTLDAGAPVQEVRSVLHKVSARRLAPSRAEVQLAKADEIPNRDFILRYRTATDAVQSAFLTHYEPGKGGYFSLILLPPRAPKAEQVSPKEVIFVMDQSGSQRGFPMEKSKELTLKLLERMGPRDTFNVMGFSSEVNPLWPAPRINSATNREEAAAFVRDLQANGGTQLEKAVVAALAPPPDPGRLRIVLFNTDGFAGQEPVILDNVRKFRGSSRMFVFGIGNSVNRHLVDAMSVEGRGDSEVVTLAEGADAAVERFVRRATSPVLTHVNVGFEGVAVQDQAPSPLPDVFSERPVVVYGRYAKPGRGRVVLTGRLGGKPWTQTLDLDFSDADRGMTAVPTLWARRQVEALERAHYLRKAHGDREGDSKEAIVQVALDHGIMTSYTSFVAVEKRVVNVGGRQRTVRVPVEMADGVSYEGIFGEAHGLYRGGNVAARGRSSQGGAGGGMGGGGFGGGMGGSAGPTAGAPLRVPASPSVPAKKGVEFVTFDPATNSYIVRDEKTLSAEQRYELKVAKSLRAKKGKVEVQVTLKAFTEENLKALRQAGLKIDGKDKALKVVFGTGDAKILKALAQLAFVQRVEPFED